MFQPMVTGVLARSEISCFGKVLKNFFCNGREGVIFYRPDREKDLRHLMSQMA